MTRPAATSKPVEDSDRRLVRPALPHEIDSVIALLKDAARWSSRFGVPIWKPDEFTVDEHTDLLDRGELIVGLQDEALAATMRLQTEDRLFWPEDQPGDALYIHKLAVDRSYARSGWPSRLVGYARISARNAHIPFLKLDTVPLPRMLDLYRDLGFVLVDGGARDFAGRQLVRLRSNLKAVGSASRGP